MDNSLTLIAQEGEGLHVEFKVLFDEALNKRFKYPDDFSSERFSEFLKQCQIQTSATPEDILLSLNVATEEKGQLQLTNAAVLFFAEHPRRFFPEAYITAVSYNSHDRFSILEKQDFAGDLIQQIENTFSFVKRTIGKQTSFSAIQQGLTAASSEIYDYPVVALREVIINAVTHRDYYYDSSHIYIHIYPDRIEVENPGGLPRGMSPDVLGKRSVRRNRLIADLLHRAHYIDRVGSGFDRMHRALDENNNPPLEVSSTNFFSIRFYKRVVDVRLLKLSERQRHIYQLLTEKNEMSKAQLATLFRVSDDTVLRDLNVLITEKLIVRSGTGRASKYQVAK